MKKFSVLNDLRDKRVLLVALILIIALIFPTSKNYEVSYVGKDGSAGSLIKQRLAPWWLPQIFLKKTLPLESASEKDVEELIKKAYERKDIKALKVIEKSYPQAEAVALKLENELGSEEKNSGNSGSSENRNEESAPPSSQAGGTIEARIPASISGFQFVTESRSILSWLGVYRSKNDINITSLEVSIELIGEKEAKKEVETQKKAFAKSIKPVRVKGLEAYFVVVSPTEAKLFFRDGDFLYEFKLILKGAAQDYQEELVKIAEEAFI